MPLRFLRELYYGMRRWVLSRFFFQIAQSDFGRTRKDEKINWPRFFTFLVENLIPKHHKTVSWGDRLLTLDKSQNFIQDSRFNQAFREIMGSHTYDQYGGKDTIIWRLNTLVWAARRSLSLDGDFIECGTFKGDMAWVIIKAISFEAMGNRTFYLYDSFEGFSRIYSSENDFPENPGFLEYAERFYKTPGLYENVKERFEEFDNVHIIKGFLPDSLLYESHKNIAFLHIDLNSPGPEIAVLEHLYENVVSGGSIILDDFGWILHKKQMEAEIAFFEERNQVILELPTGQGLIVKR